MKRFYCTICNKVRRVRRLPSDVDTFDARIDGPAAVGICRWHHSGQTHTAFTRNTSRQATQPTPPRHARVAKFKPATRPQKGKQRGQEAEAVNY